MEKIIVEEMARLPTFSHAAIIGQTVFVSGTLGTHPGTMELIQGGVGPQTTQTLENISRILEEAGSSAAHIAKVNVFMSDISEFPEMNQAYGKFFSEDAPPARITVGGVGLALGAAVEIDCIAERPE